MSMRRREPEASTGDDVVELAALADGSLAPAGRALLAARVAESSELADRLAEQERAVTLIQTTAADVQAPAALRARVGVQRRARRTPTRRVALIGVTAAALAAIGIGLGVRGSGTAS